MIINAAGGGGSGGLNFKIVGGLTEPSNPKENTIWVVTEHKITNWVMSGSQPDVMDDGGVWIKIGYDDSHEFNVLKKNKIVIHAQETYQCLDGAFEEVPLKIFQNGEWKFSDSVFLYMEGTGWMVEYVTTKDTGISISVNDDRILVTGSKSSSILTESILVNRNTLCIDAKCTFIGSDSSWRGSLVAKSSSQISGSGDDRDPSNSVGRTVFSSDSTRRVYELDISSFKGQSLHFGVAGNFSGEIYNMWMEN